MSDLTPVNVVCHRIADRPAPSVDSTAERCIQCTAPVWLSLATAAAIERMGRTSDARVFCVTCAKPALKNTIAVLSSGHVSTGEAGRARARRPRRGRGQGKAREGRVWAGRQGHR